MNFFPILSLFLTNNQTKIFHEKFHQNQIINKDLKILGKGGLHPIEIFFNSCLIFNQHSNDVLYIKNLQKVIIKGDF